MPSLLLLEENPAERSINSNIIFICVFAVLLFLIAFFVYKNWLTITFPELVGIMFIALLFFLFTLTFILSLIAKYEKKDKKQTMIKKGAKILFYMCIAVFAVLQITFSVGSYLNFKPSAKKLKKKK